MIHDIIHVTLGIFVLETVTNTNGDSVFSGEEILSINGVEVKSLSQSEIADLVKGTTYLDLVVKDASERCVKGLLSLLLFLIFCWLVYSCYILNN